ncbi:MAG: four helix bundle protein [Myxococcales bacterium]|nr:four helix bundle protein [Myxococcales bacterium]
MRLGDCGEGAGATSRRGISATATVPNRSATPAPTKSAIPHPRRCRRMSDQHAEAGCLEVRRMGGGETTVAEYRVRHRVAVGPQGIAADIGGVDSHRFLCQARRHSARGFPYQQLDCYPLAVGIFRWVLARHFPTGSGTTRCSDLADQAIRASQSVVLNLAEGGARGGPAGRNHFRIALGSAAQLSAVLDLVDLPDIAVRRAELSTAPTGPVAPPPSPPAPLAGAPPTHSLATRWAPEAGKRRLEAGGRIPELVAR